MNNVGIYICLNIFFSFSFYCLRSQSTGSSVDALSPNQRFGQESSSPPKTTPQTSPSPDNTLAEAKIQKKT